MADRPQPPESRRHLLDEGPHGIPLQIRGLQSSRDAAEVPQPASGLRQRYAYMPASAFARLARLCYHRAERHQIAGGMIEHLRRQFLWPVDAGGLAFGMV